MNFQTTVVPITEKFQDPYYPVEVSVIDTSTGVLYQGEVIFHHDRRRGKYLVDDAEVEFKTFIKSIQNTHHWRMLSQTIANAVFLTDTFKKQR